MMGYVEVPIEILRREYSRVMDRLDTPEAMHIDDPWWVKNGAIYRAFDLARATGSGVAILTDAGWYGVRTFIENWIEPFTKPEGAQDE